MTGKNLHYCFIFSLPLFQQIVLAALLSVVAPRGLHGRLQLHQEIADLPTTPQEMLVKLT